MVAAAVAGGTAVAGLAGSAMSSSAASGAASKQAAAANTAAANQVNMYNQNRADLSPFRDAGSNALTTLGQQMPALTTAFQPTEAQLQATPGYQFDLSQGLQGVQNSASARGLGVSGAALKGAASYATGLADNTYQNQANLYYAGQNNAYSKLMGVANMGENAAAQTGNLGQQAANGIGNDLTGAGNAQAAGMVGSANALSGGLNSAGSAGMNYLMMSKLFNPSSGGASGIDAGSWD